MELFAPNQLGSGKLLGVFEDGSSEWHTARENSIGGSDVGTILGLSPFSSAYQLWCVKTGRIESQPVNNYSVRFGKAFEQPILEMWAEDHPDWEVYKTGTYQHQEHHWAIANLDAIAKNKQTGELMVLEVKTSRSSWDSLPPAYEAQVKWYLWLTRIQNGLVIGVTGWNWVEIPVQRNDFEEQATLARVKKFVDGLKTDTPPEWDGSNITYEIVRQLHPDIDDTEIDLGELGIGLVSAQIAYDEAEAKLNAYKSATLDAMGKSKFGIVEMDGYEKRTVAVRQARGGGVPWLVVKKG